MPTLERFGTWTSPVSADSLAAGLSATDVCIDGHTIYWTEVVPSEKGRGQIFSRTRGGEAKKLLPPGYSCRTRVHEYGGGSFTARNGLVVFSNDIDSCLYTIKDDALEPVTEDSNGLVRYADFRLNDAGTHLIAIKEEHPSNGGTPADVKNTLVYVELSTKSVGTLAEGCDFYSSPRLYGDKVAYISWNHSNMPWDYTQLNVAKINSQWTELYQSHQVPTVDESFVQPEFGSDGTLYVASDRSGFWNLYRLVDESIELLLPEPLSQEFAGPAWRLNDSYYTPFVSDPNKLVCSNKKYLAILDIKEKTLTNIEGLSKYVTFSHIHSYQDTEGHEVIVANATSTSAPCELVAYQKGGIDVVRPSTAPALDLSYVSEAEEIEFPTTNGKTAYAYYYAPKNPEYQGRPDEKPPLRVLSHGGPTSSTNPGYSRSIQFWTTRGYAIVDVNYGGSTGYGREYRNRLKKQWGIVDVDDCCNAALYLAKEGKVDEEKLAIEGGSAGGYTTLASIAFHNVFKAACCQYGISDISLLVKETHKFESRYPDGLIGEWPEDRKVYEERSPLNSADKIECPVIFFQGAEDKVVPPSQAEVMVNALKNRKVPVAYVLYEGEGHGFRDAENIKRTVELEHWFYGQIFGFSVPDVDPVTIYNYPKEE